MNGFSLHIEPPSYIVKSNVTCSKLTKLTVDTTAYRICVHIEHILFDIVRMSNNFLN